MVGQRRFLFVLLLLIALMFSVLNICFFLYPICGHESIWTLNSFSHHGNNDLRILPKLWQKRNLDASRKHHKNFLYITQTESCLPGHFLQDDQLGTKSDFLVLSWKSPCFHANQYEHVRYIYSKENTTWSTGRNLLYSKILKNNINIYLYFIFMDDDVMLYHTEPYQVYHKQYRPLNARLSRDVVTKYLRHREKRLQRGNNPYREFERFLLNLRPAVGLVNFCFERREACMSQYIPDIWHAFCKGMTPFPYVSYSNFDGAFNAFHRDALRHLLPYHVTYDHVNWQESQKYLILESDIKFQGQVLYNLLVMGHGTKHRQYPRHFHWHQNWDRILQDLRKSMDTKYHNQIELQPFRGTQQRRFDVIRNPLPPHTPIKPYSHFTMNRTRSCRYKPDMYHVYNNLFHLNVKR